MSRLTFLGTRGEIESKPKGHKRHSCIVLEHENQTFMFEYPDDITQGDLDKYKPDYILVSHAHPDHSYGLLKLDPKVPVYMTHDTYNRLKDKKGFVLAYSDVKFLSRLGYIGKLRVQVIPTKHSPKIAPSVAFKFWVLGKPILYTSDLYYIPKSQLKNVWLYIGDGSFLKRDMIRVGKKGERYGHAGIETQMKWVQEAKIPNVIFTHFGEWVKGKNMRSIFTELSNRFGVNVHIANDSRTFKLTRKKLDSALRSERTFDRATLGRVFGSPYFDDHMLDCFGIWKRHNFTVEKLKELQREDSLYKDVVTMQNELFEMFALYTASKGIKLPHIKLNEKWFLDAAAKMIVKSHLAFYPDLLQNQPYDIPEIHDDEKKKLTRKHLTGLPAIYLVEPHARMIWERTKTLIVKSIKHTKYVGQLIYFIEDHRVYGILKITAVKGPYKADQVRTQLRDKHRISDEEWRRWWPGKKGVYLYEFTLVKKFAEPAHFEPPPGVQIWIREVELPEIEKGGPALPEVTPPKKLQKRLIAVVCIEKPSVGSLTAKFGKTQFFMFFDVLSFGFKFHRNTAMTGVGTARSIPEGVSFVVCKKIKAPSLAVLKAKGIKVFEVAGKAGYALEKSGVVSPIKNWTDEQLSSWLSQLNDKQCRHWFGKLFAWRKLIKEKKTDLTLTELKRRYKLVIKEFKRRGWGIPEKKLETETLPIAPSGIEKGEELTFEELKEVFSKPFWLKKPYIIAVGGIVVRQKTKGDVDLVISHPQRVDSRDSPVEFRLGRAASAYKKKWNGRLDFHYGAFGASPFTDYYPLYDLLAVPSELRKVVKMEALEEFFETQIMLGEIKEKEAQKQARKAKEEDKLHSMQFFAPAKPSIGHLPAERYSIDSLITLIPEEAYPVSCEKKYDGNLLTIMKDGDKVSVKTGTGIDVTSRLPETVKEIKKWNVQTVTLCSDTEKWHGKEYIGRENVAAYLVGKVPPDDSELVHNIFDIVYFYDPKMKKHDLNCQAGDIHKETYNVRRKFLGLLPFTQSTMGVPDLKKSHFNEAPMLIAENAKQLKALVKKASKAPASEGTVVKSLVSKYPLTGACYKWWKYKKTADLHAIILKALPTKGGYHRYRVGLRIPAGWKVKNTATIDNKTYMDIGKTMTYAKKRLTVGTIVTVNFEELFFYKDPETDMVQLIVYVPNIVGIREQQTVPDSAEEAVLTAQNADILRKKTEHLSYTKRLEEVGK